MTSLRKVDINLLAVLDALLTEQNLTRAGESLNMTQPAVSNALYRLRKHYGDPLLVRSGRSFTLTERARELQPSVHQAVAAIDGVLALTPTFNPREADRTFYVAGSDYVLSELASPLLTVARQDAPGVHLEFEPLPWTAEFEPADLLRRDVTIAGAGRGVPGKRQSLFSDRYVCIIDAANERLVNGNLTLDDLRHLRYVRSIFGDDRGAPADDMLSAAGIDPDVAISVPGFMPVPFAVAGTDLVGFVPEFLARRYAPTLGLQICQTPLAAVTLIEAAHWHPSKTDDPALAWLLRMLRRASELLDVN